MKFVAALSILVALSLVGCRSGKRTATTAPTTASRPTTIPIEYEFKSIEVKPQDPRVAPVQVYYVEVYQIFVPYGTISVDDNFWKRIDETAVDVATHDLLLKNGIRTGLLREPEMAVAKQLIENYPVQVKRSTLVGAETKGSELEALRHVDIQSLFFFDQNNELQGRTYERCQNVISVSYTPAPRKRQTLRVTLSPIVHCIRRSTEYTALNQEFERELPATDRLYDLNLRADVPANCALIVAPSAESRRKSSIGHAFLTNDAAAEKQECILMILARPTKSATPAR